MKELTNRTIAPPFREIKEFNLQEAVSTVLDNGLPVHYVNAGSQPVIRFELILKSGISYENQKGVSSFTTKMLSEGTGTISAGEISEGFDKYGAFLELESGMDYNYITLYGLNRHLEVLLPLLYEITYNSQFPEKELDLLKSIHVQELSVNLEKNSFVAGQKFRNALFGDSSYGKELGEEEILSINAAHLKEFYANTFFNEPQILLSGAVNSDVLALVNATFGKRKLLTAQGNNNLPASLPNAQKIVVEKEKSLQSSIRLGKIFPGKNHPDFISLLVLNEILGGYFGSRLMKNIREDKGYTYGIYSRIVNYKKASYIMMATDVKREYTANTIHEIKNEIKILQNELISDDELNSVRSFMLGSFLSSINTPFSLADKFKSVHFFGLDYNYYKKYLDTLNSIDAETIRRLAIQYLDTDSLTEIIVGGEF